MAVFTMDVRQVDELVKAVRQYEGDAESAINDVLHNEAGNMAQDAIKQIMPVSGRSWAGKKAAARGAKSLRNRPSNLAITVTTTGDYQYLYFPDDGTSTQRHVGNQQFFWRGGEKVQDKIIDRCIKRLIDNF